MSIDDKTQEPTSTKRIQDAYEVGAINDGQDVAFNLRMEDGSKEWFSIHHTRVAELIAGLTFAAGIAARERPEVSASGNPLPEQSHLIDDYNLSWTSFPGASFVVLRLELAQGLRFDLRLPLSKIEAIQDSLAQSASLAQSGKSPSVH